MTVTIYHDLEQGTDDWFKERLGSLGSSSVKSAMAGGQGKSRKTLAYKLIAESITGERVESFKSDSMAEGNRREQESRDYFEVVTGIHMEEVGLIRNDKYPGQHTSPDGINCKYGVGLELKNPQANTMVKYLEQNKLPNEYRQQVQHAMLITGYESWWFVAYHPGFENQLMIGVKRDDAYIREIETKLGIFFGEMAKIREKIERG